MIDRAPPVPVKALIACGILDWRRPKSLLLAPIKTPHRDPANRGVTIGRRDSANAALRRPGVDWVIAGGESGGTKRREMDLTWLTSIVAQCQSAGVPVHVKQDSGPRPGLQGHIPDDLWALKQFPSPAA